MTVLHQALKLMPNDDFLFYADTLHVPYGVKPKDEVRKYIFDAADFMADQGTKALVIACNTATSIAVDELRQRYDFPAIGIELAVKPAVQISEGKTKKVLVFATNLTLKEEKFQSLVKRVDYQEIVEYVPLPGLVQFAEINEEKVIPYLQKELVSHDLSHFGTVVLGCTHFPFLERIIQKVSPDGSLGTAKNLKRILEARNQLGNGTGDIQFFQSGKRVEDSETLMKYKGFLNKLDEIYS